MADKIYKTVKGKRVELTSREIKSYVMKQRGWDTERYNKEYDKLRNRVRAYERYQKSRGEEVTPQSPSNILYFETRAMKRQGKDYTPSLERERLQAFPSVSSGKALTERQIRRLTTVYEGTTQSAFARLIEVNPTAQLIGVPHLIIIDEKTGQRRIAMKEDFLQEEELKRQLKQQYGSEWEEHFESNIFKGYLIDNEVKREKALKDLAKKLHAQMDATGKVQDASAIPFGHAIGSDQPVSSFSISSYQ